MTKRSKKPFALPACSDTNFKYRSQTIALHTSTCSLRKKFTSIVDVFALNSNVGKQVLTFAKPRDIFNLNFTFAITRFKDKIRFGRSSTWLVRTYLYPFLLCAKLYLGLILTSFEGQIPCVFCKLASEKCSGSRNYHRLKFSQADKPAGFFIFLRAFSLNKKKRNIIISKTLVRFTAFKKSKS